MPGYIPLLLISKWVAGMYVYKRWNVYRRCWNHSSLVSLSFANDVSLAEPNPVIKAVSYVMLKLSLQHVQPHHQACMGKTVRYVSKEETMG